MCSPQWTVFYLVFFFFTIHYPLLQFEYKVLTQGKSEFYLLLGLLNRKNFNWGDPHLYTIVCNWIKDCAGLKVSSCSFITSFSSLNRTIRIYFGMTCLVMFSFVSVWNWGGWCKYQQVGVCFFKVGFGHYKSGTYHHYVESGWGKWGNKCSEGGMDGRGVQTDP